VKQKEQDIVHLIHEQDKLAKELQYINEEKKVMEKMLGEKFEAMLFLNTETQGTQRNTEKSLCETP
jgi:hypothetical protein